MTAAAWDDAALLGVLERVVEKATRRGAAAAEGFATVTRDASVRVERGRVTRASAARAFGLAVRVLDAKGRPGFAYATSEADADRAVATALDAARVIPAQPGFAFPEPAEYRTPPGLHDARVRDLTPGDGVAACHAMMDAARAEAPGITLVDGRVGWGEERVAIASTTGVSGAYAATHVAASLNGVLRDGGETTTGFGFALSRAADVDHAEVGRECGDLAARSRGAKALPDGETTVVFRATALDGLMDAVLVNALTAETVAAGRSVYAERVGERVMPSGYGLVDDGQLAGGLRSAPFDDEGVPTRATPLVEDGVLRALLEDAAGAAERGSVATGSALRAERLVGGRSFRSPPCATGLNVRFTGPVAPFHDLVADVDRGVLVHDAMGAHTANPASGDFSVNAATLFAIEDGAVTHAGKPALVSGNLPAALTRLKGLADDARDVGGGFGPAAFRLPTVALDGVRVTGA